MERAVFVLAAVSVSLATVALVLSIQTGRPGFVVANGINIGFCLVAVGLVVALRPKKGR